MIITLLFLVALLGFLGWWLLARQGLMTKPWLETATPAEVVDTGASPLPIAKIGLGVFLGVAGTLLMLLVSAYAIRMDMEDWRPLPWPQLLWANTAVLVLSSVALHRARAAARRTAPREEVRSWLLVGGLAAVAFLVGQILAWRQLAEAGYRPATNPADAFFYLLTAIHALHVLGGLVALARAAARLRHAGIEALRLSVELCATYWHFLLVAWIVLFALLAYAPVFPWLYAICRAPFG